MSESPFQEIQMEDSNLIQSEIRDDALNRLEWPELMQELAKEAVFLETQEEFINLKPWLEPSQREWYFTAVQELSSLLNNSSGFALSAINFSQFLNFIKQSRILPAISLYELLRLLRIFQTAASFSKNISNSAYFSRLVIIPQLLQQISPISSLQIQLEKSVNAEGQILSTASEELKSARDKLENIKRRIAETLDNLMNKSHVKDVLQDSIWVQRDGRYVLPIRADRRGEIQGISHGVSTSGATIFLEPQEVHALHSQKDHAEIEVQIEENRVLRKLSEEAHGWYESIKQGINTLLTYDNILARLQFARKLEGCRPVFSTEVNSEERFSFVAAKHPLYVLEGKYCVPNNLRMAAEYSPANPNQDSKYSTITPRIWVLSGPNAGGKTVALKTVGICVLMAKAGLFVPAYEARLFEFQNVFVEIGDRQSREENLSTFSGHLLHVKKIIDTANSSSLLLLDEGFVGTDPAVGVALARATLEHLAAKDVTTIITTHFSTLKLLANDDFRFLNASMEFEPSELRPTYSLLNGCPGQSFALELGKRIGFNQDVLDQAYEYYGSEAQSLEKILADLQEKRSVLYKQITDNNDLKESLQQEITGAQQERENFKKLKDNFTESYRNKLQKKLNMFEHLLQVREKQFEKHLQKEFLNTVEKVDIEKHISVANSNSLSEASSTLAQNPPNKLLESKNNDEKNKKKLTSFDQLAHVKFKDQSIKQRIKASIEHEVSELSEGDFPKHKHYSSRSLLDEARDYLENVSNEYQELSREIKEKITDIVGEEEKKHEQLVENLSEYAIAQHPASFWQAGMQVKCKKFRELGTVLRESDAKGFIECRFGIIKSKINYTELEEHKEIKLKHVSLKKIIQEKNHAKAKVSTGKSIVKRAPDLSIESTLQMASNTLDLRGSLVENAIDNLQYFIDKAIANGIERLIIIHGHGTGKVKQGVRDYLSTTKTQLAYRPGHSGEGGDGVTVVQLQA